MDTSMNETSHPARYYFLSRIIYSIPSQNSLELQHLQLQPHTDGTYQQIVLLGNSRGETLK